MSYWKLHGFITQLPHKSVPPLRNGQPRSRSLSPMRYGYREAIIFNLMALYKVNGFMIAITFGGGFWDELSGKFITRRTMVMNGKASSRNVTSYVNFSISFYDGRSVQVPIYCLLSTILIYYPFWGMLFYRKELIACDDSFYSNAIVWIDFNYADWIDLADSGGIIIGFYSRTLRL